MLFRKIIGKRRREIYNYTGSAKELRLTEKTLAEAALLELRKKAHAILVDPEEN